MLWRRSFAAGMTRKQVRETQAHCGKNVRRHAAGKTVNQKGLPVGANVDRQTRATILVRGAPGDPPSTDPADCIEAGKKYVNRAAMICSEAASQSASAPVAACQRPRGFVFQGHAAPRLVEVRDWAIRRRKNSSTSDSTQPTVR